MNEKQLTAFLQLSPTNSKLLKRRAKQYQFDRPGPVIHKGQPVSGAYLVLDGELRVYTYSPSGTEATLYLLRPGETCVLTLNCLFNDLRYPAWVEASANSRVVMIPGDLYRQFFSEEPSVRDTTLKALSTLAFRLMDELEEVHTCNLEQRLARFLLNNASSDGIVRMTQQTLANHLGTTREVIARLMQNFNAHGMVSTGRGRVTVKDAASLAALITPDDAAWPE
jgi:CRP/FNR family transcriptional regulator